MLVKRNEFKEKDGTTGYVESVFNSDNVLKTTYFFKNQRLYIAFNRGDIYSYGNVTPEFYEEFENAESQGKFFYKNMNKNKAYPARKEYTLYPTELQEIKKVVEENKIEEDEDE